MRAPRRTRAYVDFIRGAESIRPENITIERRGRKRRKVRQDFFAAFAAFAFHGGVGWSWESAGATGSPPRAASGKRRPEDQTKRDGHGAGKEPAEKTHGNRAGGARIVERLTNGHDHCRQHPDEIGRAHV